MEQFRDIEGYEGMYAVSNEGNVKSLNYHRSGEEKILIPVADGGGYLRILLYKEGKRKLHSVHRLVAEAFIPNPDKLPQVNHKDECKTNNCVFVNEDGSIDYEKSNLEWCDSSYNINHGTRNARTAEALSIPVDMLTKQGVFICSFSSSHEAEKWLRANGFPKARQCNITMCCQGKHNIAYGHKWCYS